MMSHMPNWHCKKSALARTKRLRPNQSRANQLSVVVPLVLAMGVANAETAFVDDTLRIGVRAEPSSRVSSLTIIGSGTAVEVLEKKAGYTRVRTPSGQQGWVKSAYLTSQRPLRLNIDEAQKKIAGLEKDLAQARGATKNNDPVSAVGTANSPIGSNDEGLRKTLAELERDKARLIQQVRDARARSAAAPPMPNRFIGWIDSKTGDANPNLVLLGVISVMLTVGFMLGMGWHRRKVSRRLGGISL